MNHYSKMDPEAKAVWVKALRSNKYTSSVNSSSHCTIPMAQIRTARWAFL